MFEFASSIFDTSGFVTRDNCGIWTDELKWMHIGGDLFIWLAYLSIPIVLLFFVRRRDLPYPRLFVLFALFILACGFGHLIEALMFRYPLYRLAGVVKVITATVSWATVLAMIPMMPRVMASVQVPFRSGSFGDTTLHRLVATDRLSRVRDYIIAVLAAVLALLVRAAIEPLVKGDHFYVISLLAVVFVSWQCGFGPGIVTLLASMIGMIFFFIGDERSFVVKTESNQLATAAFFFCGVCCSGLGEAQRVARKRAKAALEVALERKAELEIEVARRKETELALRQSEATLRAFYDSAPVSMGIVEPLDDDVLHVFDNAASGRFFGVEPGGTVGRRETSLGTPADLVAMWLGKYRESRMRKEPVRFEYEYDSISGRRWLSATVSPIGTDPRGRELFCYIAEDATEQKRAEESVRQSEEQFRQLADSMPQIVFGARPDGHVDYYNRKWYEYTGFPDDGATGDESWVGVHEPEAVEHISAAWHQSLRTGQPYQIEYRLRRADGVFRWHLGRALPMKDANGKIVRWFGTNTDIDDAKRATEEAAERARLAALRADIATALSAGGRRLATLQRCVQTLVRHAGAAFARIWTTDDTGQWLILQASAGMYTHTDGAHGRVRIGDFKIGRIAASGRPHFTNDVLHDPNVSDPAWAEREQMVAFAGYPLIVEGRVHGVMALFARHELTEQLQSDLGLVSENIAQYLERRRAAEQMQESEEKFRSMAESIPQLAWMARANGDIFWFNQKWYEYTGTTPSEMEGWGWQRVHDPAVLPAVTREWRASLESGEPFEMVFPIKGADDHFRPFLTRVLPSRDQTGAIVRWFGTNTDITKQLELEQALRNAAERYRTLTEAIPQIVWNTDARGEVTYFNHRWLEYTHLPLEQARGGGWTNAIHPDDRDRVYTEWRTTITNGSNGECDRFAHELRLKNALTGEYRWFLTVAVPLRRGDGSIDQWIGSMSDIHDQKTVEETLETMVQHRTADLLSEVEDRRRAEQEIRVMATELTRSNGELEQFAYIASHDLQEPLRKIQAFGDRLKTRFRNELPEDGKEYVDRMDASARRMRRLIDDLLNYSRVTTMARAFSTVNLSKLVHEVVADLDVRIAQVSGRVDVGELPEIDADPTQMRQLFQNLIANALKFQRPGVPPVVEIRGELVSEPLPEANDESVPACRITVRDNGIGFDEKYLSRIFQVFQRLHGRNEYEGTGVGLAICRKIAERHGGTITAQSRTGEGATFVVALPVRQPREETTADVRPAEETRDDSDGG